jgi:hypothetical protein
MCAGMSMRIGMLLAAGHNSTRNGMPLAGNHARS